MLSENLLSEIKRKSELLNSLKPLSKENQAKLDKKFRLEFNFNSNHLEGNTLTYGETELLLIFDQTEGTHEFREYEEMQAHDVALRIVLQEAAERERPLTEQFIRSLNEKLLVKSFWKDAITADGQPTRKQINPGEYKKTPNSVRLANGEIFNYSAPADVEHEIAELVTWYNDKSETEDPVLLASILHYRFVRIHPFDDGNGRTARLLMNYVFAKSNLPLVVIKSEEKKEYLAALNRADAGNLNAFVEYIGNQLLWSLDLSIQAAKGEDIEEDEDLDKELELLKQGLKGIPNSFEKRKSSFEVSQLMHKSIVPLYHGLLNKIDKIEELFVDFKSSINFESASPNGSTSSNTLNKKTLDKLYTNTFAISPFEIYSIMTTSLTFEFTALKKSLPQRDLSYRLTVFFQKYHYGIFDHVTKTNLIQKPYGIFFKEIEIRYIVNVVMKNIIKEIKEATNLNN